MEHLVWNPDPVLASFMGFKIHWYGVLFALAITAGFQVMKRFYIKENLGLESLDTLLVYCVTGIIVGARLGHCFFYDPAYYLAHPLKILAIWEGGLASHGGGVGVTLAMYFYQRKVKLPFLFLLDRIAIATAIFAFFVRIANFVNSEILGEPTTQPWGIIFSRVDMLPRHPAQLYEAFAYLIIFIFLYAIYSFTQIKQRHGAILGLFLVLAFGARVAIESIKVSQTAYTETLLTAGQWLSLPFLAVGIVLLFFAYQKKGV